VRLAAEDAEVHELLARVSQLLKPAAAVSEPAIRSRVMALMATA